jgi:uncharacterized protein YkwD
MENPRRAVLIILIISVMITASACPVIRREVPPPGETPARTPAEPAPTPREEQVSPEEVPSTPTQMEMELFDEVNDRRTENDLPPLEFDETAYRAAKYHSMNMARQGFFAHESPAGQTPTDRFELFDFNFANRMWGENIAMNFNLPNPIEATADGWMESPGHRENILEERYRYAAIGIEQNEEGHYYYTQKFWGNL